MKTIIFVRGTNATRQIKICEKYAAANDLDVIGAVNNEIELTAFVMGDRVECVLVSDVTRVTRRRSEYITAERMFNEFGVKLIAAEGGVR